MMRLCGTGLYPPFVPAARGGHADGAVDSGAVYATLSQCPAWGPLLPRYALARDPDAKQVAERALRVHDGRFGLTRPIGAIPPVRPPPGPERQIRPASGWWGRPWAPRCGPGHAGTAIAHRRSIRRR